MVHNPNLPLSWYVAKLERGEPFTSLLYGDGEFQVMSRRFTGQAFTNYREVVSVQLEDELIASLDDPDPSTIRGTDLNLIDWRQYGGRDVAHVREVSERAQAVIGDRKIDWVDGTVWDTAVREGKLGPLIKALRNCHITLVSNYRLFVEFKGLRPWMTVAAEEKNAAGHLDWLEQTLKATSGCDCFVVCMGLGAIPLIMRLRKHFPQATFLDLGSTFDVFAGIGAERGWRRELYEDKAKWQACIDANLEGL